MDRESAVEGDGTNWAAPNPFLHHSAVLHRLPRDVAQAVVEKVQEHIGRLSVAYYDSNKTGILVSRIMSDVEGVRNLIGTGLVEFLGGLLTAAIALVVLFRISAGMTLMAIGFLSVFALALRKAFGIMRPIFRERSKINAEVSGRLTESLGGVRVVKGYHAEQREHLRKALAALKAEAIGLRSAERPALSASPDSWYAAIGAR